MNKLKEIIMNKIKMLIACIATVFSGNAMAQKVVAEDVVLEPNGTAELVINLEADVKAASGQMTVTLPEGITISKKSKGELLNEDATVTVNSNNQVLIFDMSKNEFTATSGTVVTLTLAAGEIAEGEYTGTISDIKFANLNASSIGDIADVTFKINVTAANGIKTVNVKDLEGDVYTLGGQKVAKVTKKGLYVVNGKKVIVK